VSKDQFGRLFLVTEAELILRQAQDDQVRGFFYRVT
jgi:hypothetical protein